MNTLTYPGSEKTRGDCELIALGRIPIEYRDLEANLFDLKWFDYRLLHPTHATYLFAHRYEQAVRKNFWQTKDHTKAEELVVFSDPDVFKTRDALSVWIARQRFDTIGVRYEFALGFAMNRFSERGWRMCPRPNQLYGEELLLDILDAWKIECAASLQFPVDPFFRAPIEGPAARVKTAYQSWVIDQVRKRSAPAYQWRPLSRLLGEGVLTADEASLQFGDQITKKAIAVGL